MNVCERDLENECVCVRKRKKTHAVYVGVFGVVCVSKKKKKWKNKNEKYGFTGQKKLLQSAVWWIPG